jgi:3-deoxy-manno-octulosonate cytidylyltransferase (CMP-KDO synthetase)
MSPDSQRTQYGIKKDYPMATAQKCYGIIPARYESTRFPGKPLADINGRPMIWHVYQRANRCVLLDQVAVATDDQRIELAAKRMGIPVVMTRNDHISGTDRVLEAAVKLNAPEDSVIVNIQGDEPALHPDMISELIRPFSDLSTQVTTLARTIDQTLAQSPDVVKVVFDRNNKALYFSRAFIPFPRENEPSLFYVHIGLYAFRFSVLKKFVSLPPGRLESIEKLEQLRLLENQIPIQMVLTSHISFGVDRPEDIEKVKKLLEQSASGD